MLTTMLLWYWCQMHRDIVGGGNVKSPVWLLREFMDDMLQQVSACSVIIWGRSWGQRTKCKQTITVCKSEVGVTVTRSSDTDSSRRPLASDCSGAHVKATNSSLCLSINFVVYPLLLRLFPPWSPRPVERDSLVFRWAGVSVPAPQFRTLLGCFRFPRRPPLERLQLLPFVLNCIVVFSH